MIEKISNNLIICTIYDISKDIITAKMIFILFHRIADEAAISEIFDKCIWAVIIFLDGIL